MNFKDILNELNQDLKPFGFECHAFKIKWYNDQVDNVFKLSQYHDDTFAVLILNLPSMFEKLFLPYLFKNFKNNHSHLDLVSDPIDVCLGGLFDQAKQKLERKFSDNSIDIEVDTIRDFDMIQRRAKILMQTAAHISGAGYFYDKRFLPLDFNNNNKKLMGVCLHPEYGGWFAMRCVFIFRNYLVDDLEQKSPKDMLNGDLERIAQLLERFNFNWKDWSYRDIIPTKEKYSELQKEYFNTEPKLRKDLIKSWLKYSSQESLCIAHKNKLNYNEYLINNFYLI